MSSRTAERSSRVRGLTALVGPLVVLIVGVLLWWFVSTWNFVVPSPPKAIAALIDLLGQTNFRENLIATAYKIVIAILIAVGLGTLAGLALGTSARIRTAFEPLVVAGNAVPKIVLYPVLVLFLSLGNQSQIAMGVLFAFFPVMINVAAGVRGIPQVYWKLARSLQASRRQVVTRILLPAIRKPFLTGIRLAVSLSSVGVVIAEIFATRLGLGRYIMRAYGSGFYDEMVATILLLVTSSSVVSLLLWRAERNVR